MINGFSRAFKRQPDGCWICICPTEWQSPVGRIQVAEGSRFSPGIPFMGVDLAKLLDEATWSHPT